MYRNGQRSGQRLSVGQILGLPRVPRPLRAVIFVILALLLLPYLLTLLYAVVNPLSTVMLWRQLSGARVEQRTVPLSRIAPALPLAVIVAEDGRFCSHHGIDFRGLREAFADADDLDEMRGGSTITQQVAKNLFLWQGRSYVRKALEFPLALWLDLVLPKRRILEIYLNIAEWGPDGEFGAQAGARYAFGKDARALSAHEAALMAAILPNPPRRSAKRPGPAIRRLGAIYEGRTRTFPQRADCVLARRSSP